VVTLNGKDHYLGHWPEGQRNPPAAVRVEYDRLVAEWLANGRRLQPEPAEAEACSLSINELILAFLRHAQAHYRREDGTPTSEVTDFKLSLRPLKELYGMLAVANFGPLKLKAVRQRMADARKYRVRFRVKDGETEKTVDRRVWEHCFRRTPNGCEVLWGKKWRPAELLVEEKALSRSVINRRIGRIVRMFKWGVSEEIVPESVWRALTTVRGLEKGRTAVKERPPVAPVAAEVVLATLPHLLPPVRALAELQLHTGMRPGEVCQMRGCDLDTTSDIWLYRPVHHKTRHRGKARVVALGPKAQAVIKPFLKLETQAYLFSPRDALAALRARQRANRKTKVQPSQADRRKRKPKRYPGEKYTTNAYYHAVAKAVRAANTANACTDCKPLKPEERCEQCQAAAIPHWHPHQLRHTHATQVRRQFGLEAAQVALGHSQAQITEVYAERDLALAAKVAKQIG
jgi:integrase